MYEIHGNEQYFFDEATLEHLSAFLSRWESPCCLCAPLLGERLAARGAAVTVLDIDERFAQAPGFRRYDIFRPERLEQTFGIIVCDPPFFRTSLAQLFTAIRLLSQFRFDQPLMVSYLSRRRAALLGTFAPFGLRPSGYFPSYQTVQACERNDIEFFTNLPADQVAGLTAPAK